MLLLADLGISLGLCVCACFYLCCLQLQLVNSQSLTLQTAGTDGEKLFEVLDVILDFRDGLRGHPAYVLLNLFLLFNKFSVKREEEKTTDL